MTIDCLNDNHDFSFPEFTKPHFSAVVRTRDKHLKLFESFPFNSFLKRHPRHHGEPRGERRPPHVRHRVEHPKSSWYKSLKTRLPDTLTLKFGDH